MVPSMTGYTISWKAMVGPPRSSVKSAVTAVRLPPALSPARAIRLPSTLSSWALSATHLAAAWQSSAAAGNLFSGASR